MDTYRQQNVMDSRHQHRHRQDGNLPDYVQTVVVKDSKGLEKILLLPKALDLDRPKRSRTAFAKWQLDALETTFCSHPYLVGEQRTLLARRLGLSETQIKVWYQNRRTKQRKEGSPSSGSGTCAVDNSTAETSQMHQPTPAAPASASLSESSPESLKWPTSITQQQHQQYSAEFFGQAFHHYHPAMYQQLIQSYSAHGVAAGIGLANVNNHASAAGSHQNVAATTDRHQHRVY